MTNTHNIGSPIIVITVFSECRPPFNFRLETLVEGIGRLRLAGKAWDLPSLPWSLRFSEKLSKQTELDNRTDHIYNIYIYIYISLSLASDRSNKIASEFS